MSALKKKKIVDFELQYRKPEVMEKLDLVKMHIWLLTTFW